MKKLRKIAGGDTVEKLVVDEGTYNIKEVNNYE